jgi:hypothetical protein
MKRQWHICRTTVETTNGEQRWDQAYQLLLRWAQAEPPATVCPLPLALPFQEVSHASSDIRARIDVPSSSSPDD